MRRIVAALAAAVALLGSGRTARADDAPRDTALIQFLGGLSDSSDAYFGMAAQKPDTAGLDSALAFGLAHAGAPPRRRLNPEVSPWLGFDRVNGGVMGGGLALGPLRGIGRMSGRLGWANGPNEVLGEGGYDKVRSSDVSRWSLRLGAGRMTADMDRDYGDLRLAQVRAFLFGRDAKRYLRRDGFQTRLVRETQTFRAAIGFRDQLESPLPTTATWNLFHRTPVVVDNLPALPGRTHEFEYSATFRFGRLPLFGEVDHHTSSHAAGSQFEYRRWRAAMAADLAPWHWLAVVPQAVWGRLSGTALPQESFYIGGSRSLRHLEGSNFGGTRMALVRLDLIGAPDLLELAHIPHPAAFPLQGALFAGTGAVWGPDPYGGPGTPEDVWPGNESWHGEFGVSLLYRPGLPDPNAFVRFNYAWPAGADHAEGGRFVLTVGHGIDLLRPLGD